MIGPGFLNQVPTLLSRMIPNWKGSLTGSYRSLKRALKGSVFGGSLKGPFLHDTGSFQVNPGLPGICVPHQLETCCFAQTDSQPRLLGGSWDLVSRTKSHDPLSGYYICYPRGLNSKKRVRIWFRGVVLYAVLR